MLGCFKPTFGSNTDKPKCWVKNLFKKCTVEVGLILNYIFNPTFWFVHIWHKFGIKQPSIAKSVGPKWINTQFHLKKNLVTELFWDYSHDVCEVQLRVCSPVMSCSALSFSSSPSCFIPSGQPVNDGEVNVFWSPLCRTGVYHWQYLTE